MASVAGRCPASGVHPSGIVVRDPAVQPSGVQPVQRPVTWGRRPGSGRPAVGCPPVRCPPVRCPPVRCPAGWRPPRRSGRDASVSSHTGRWRWAQSGRWAPATTGTGRVPVGCRDVGRFGRRPSRPGRGRCWRARVLVSGASVADLAGLVRRRRVPAERPGRPARRAERPVAARRCGTGGELRREVAAPAAWLPSGAGWRPRWVVVVGPAARVGGPGGPMGLLAGMGSAAPARPRLAAGVPGSLPAAL
jgi:hypothetical protein